MASYRGSSDQRWAVETLRQMGGTKLVVRSLPARLHNTAIFASRLCAAAERKVKSAIVPNLDENTSFFGVYDGHGGDEVALLCAKIFHTELHNHPNFQDNLMSAVRSVFFRMDELLLQSDEWKELTKPPPDVWVQFLKAGVCAHYWPFILALTNPYVAPQCTGSTACIVVIRGSQIILGHVGNSRCVLSSNGQAIQLTKDHKPTEKNEAKRILGAGGKIDRVKIPITRGRFHGYKLGASRINGVLTVSRAIGDFAFKQDKNLTPQEQMVTCDPELIDMDINNDMEFLVIASDGIWDCMTTEGVVEFVHKNLRTGVTDLRIICERLIERTLPSSDNATVILVMFKHTDGISTCQRQPLLYINNDPTEEY